MPRKGYCRLVGLGRDKGSLVLCSDSGFCVATGFGLGRVFLGRDRSFLGRDRVVFIMIFCRDRGLPCVVTVFCSLS